MTEFVVQRKSIIRIYASCSWVSIVSVLFGVVCSFMIGSLLPLVFSILLFNGMVLFHLKMRGIVDSIEVHGDSIILRKQSKSYRVPFSDLRVSEMYIRGTFEGIVIYVPGFRSISIWKNDFSDAAFGRVADILAINAISRTKHNDILGVRFFFG